MEKNITPVDEILLFVQYYLNALITSASKKNVLEANNKQLFSMLSCFAYDSVSTTKGTTNLQELYILCVAAFNNTFDNLFMREEYVTVFLNHFPKKTWPPTFVLFLSLLKDEVPSEKWVKTNAKSYTSSDATTLKKLYFGYKIMTKAKDAIKEIKLHYNRYIFILSYNKLLFPPQ